MRLSLAIPESWEIKHAPNHQSLALLRGADNKPDLVITFGELILLPDEQRPWIEQTLRSDLPDGARIQVGQNVEARTELGWPMRVVEVTALHPQDDVILEERLCVFYAFLEHAAVAILRAPNKAQIEQHRATILGLLQSGKPQWTRAGQPVCLADFWNLESTPIERPITLTGTRTREATPPPTPISAEAALREALNRVDVALSSQASADAKKNLQLSRGRLLSQLGRHDEAVAAFRAAVALDNGSAEPHHLLGLALAELGRDSEAIVEWQAAVAANPSLVDVHYNIAQTHYNQGAYDKALAGWQRAFELDPSDFLTLRKVVQAQNALGLYRDAEATREQLKQLWQSSSDPRARLIHEYVSDQFSLGSLTVQTFETCNPRDASFYAVYTFRVFDAQGRALPIEIIVETSDYAAQSGTPFVLGILRGGQFTVLGTSAQLPPYAEIKETAGSLIAEHAASAKP